MSPALNLDGQHTLSLRPYQEEALAAVEAAAARGIRRQCGVAGVGAGKTVMFVALAARMNVRTLIIAHRDELIQQAAQKVRMWWPDADLGIVKAERRDFGAQDVIVASVQSLSPARLAKMGSFGLVVVDEFHHVRAPSYGRVLDTLRAGKPDGPLLLGVTATPNRSDGKGLDAYADEIVFNFDLLWLIRNGYLVDVRAKEVKMANLRLEDVTVRQGDYADGELGAAMTAAHAPWWIVKAWKAEAAGLKTLAFLPTVETAKATAAEFMAQGVRAVSVDGSMHIDERRRVMRDFSTGRYQVLTNCQVATEGYDEPSIECVIMGRPTKSVSLYTQMIGRGTRLFPGKETLLVLDVIGDAAKVDLCTAASLAGVERKALKRRTLSEAVEDQEAADAAEKEQRPAVRLPRPNADVVTRDVDLFKQHGAKPGRVKWGKTRSGGFATSVDKMSVVMEPSGEQWRVSTVSDRGEVKVLMDAVPLSLATSIAEDHVRKNAPRALVDRLAPWRKKPPTDKQLAFAQRLGIGVPPGTSGGEVGALIDARLAEIRLRKAAKR